MKLSEAIRMAKERHDGQKYGNDPYTKHLADVMFWCQVYLKANLDAEQYAEKLNIFVPASYLHDILEDTKTTAEELLEIFGEEITSLVVAVTDEPGKSRKERKEKTYIKIRQYGKDAVLLKLCDRIANVRSCIHNENHSLLKMYKKEQKRFRESLYSKEDKLENVWNDLEALMKL